MAKKHQCFQASLHGNRIKTDIICKNVVNSENGMFNINIPGEYIYATKKIEFLGTLYKEKDVILCSVDSQNNINVLIVNTIFVNKEYTDFICYGEIKKMWYNCIINLYESFEKIREKEFSIIKRKEFVFHQPIKLFQKDQKYYYASFQTFEDLF